ncbi:MAG: CDP-alcohol phosphatidyltransferase family protein [Gemmataceae bacterium]
MKPFLRHAIPNACSLGRMLLGFAFPLLPLEWRLWVILVAAITDFLDGFLARLLHAESDLGRMLDPVADKVFVLMLAGTLLAEGAIHPVWALGIAARDMAVLLGVVVVLVRGRWETAKQMRPSFLGKCTTAAQFAVLLWLVVWGGTPLWLLTLTTLLSIAAAVGYTREFGLRTERSATGPLRSSVS